VSDIKLVLIVAYASPPYVVRIPEAATTILLIAGRPVRPETVEVLDSFEQDVLEEMDLTSFERNREKQLLKQIADT